mgnify:CR=1 FL=1
MRSVRKRILYLALAALFAALGLGTRAYAGTLPKFIADHAGDALWAAMVYAGFRALLAGRSRVWAFGAALGFSFAIEFSQLYRADWINGARETALGALVLGKGFLAVDLARYFVGCAFAFGIDALSAQRGSDRRSQRGTEAD